MYESHGFATYSSDGSIIFWDTDLLKLKANQKPRHLSTLLADPSGLAKFLNLDSKLYSLIGRV